MTENQYRKKLIKILMTEYYGLTKEDAINFVDCDLSEVKDEIHPIEFIEDAINYGG